MAYHIAVDLGRGDDETAVVVGEWRGGVLHIVGEGKRYDARTAAKMALRMHVRSLPWWMRPIYELRMAYFVDLMMRRKVER